MNGNADVPVLERPAFFDGQLLDAADLGAVGRHQRELRWLHNRTLHGWGVVRGLTVAGERGDRTVAVSAGYALDCRGRELLLPEPETLTVPPLAAGPGGAPARFYLTISYVDDAEQPVSESRTGPCGEAGAVRRPERGRLRWQSPFDLDPATRYRRGLDVLLATIEVMDCRLVAAPSTALRRDLPPACAPRIAAGATPAGATLWSLHPAAGPVVGVETLVDTSAAGFGRTPTYSAHVLGDRRVAESGPGNSILIDGPASVHSPSATGFVLRVLLPRNIILPPFVLNPVQVLDATLPGRLRDGLHWRVSWLGVEG